MNKISITEISQNEALIIWKDSPHATVFTNPFVLEKIAVHTRWFLAKKGNEPLCAWPVCINNQSRPYIPNFSYFIGPIWSYSGWNTPNHRALSRRLDVYQGFIKLFEEEFSGICASLPMGINDVRAFDWWNYHNQEKPRIKILPKYTAQLKLTTEKSIKSGYRELRRREISKIEKLNQYTINENTNPEKILELYTTTISRNGASIHKDTAKEIKNLYNLVLDGHGFIASVNDQRNNNETTFIALVLRAGKTSNLVLNLTNSLYRKTGVSAYGIHMCILKSIQLGDEIFDFNGANSPQRGDDKHSYGSEEKLYFEIHHNKNK